MTIDLKRQTSSIVVLGPFNPAMFQPLWFAETALIRREEASDAHKLRLLVEQLRFSGQNGLRYTLMRIGFRQKQIKRIFSLF